MINATSWPLYSRDKETVQLYRWLGGYQGRSGRVRKIFPQPGFDPRTVQPVASRCIVSPLFFELLPSFNSPFCVTSFEPSIMSRDVLQTERKMNCPLCYRRRLMSLFKSRTDTIKILSASFYSLINAKEFISSSEEWHERKPQPYSASV